MIPSYLAFQKAIKSVFMDHPHKPKECELNIMEILTIFEEAKTRVQSAKLTSETKARNEDSKKRFDAYHDNALDEMMSFRRNDDMEHAYKSAVDDRFEHLKSKGKLYNDDDAKKRHETHKAYIDQQIATNKRESMIDMVTTTKLDPGLTYEQQHDVHHTLALNSMSASIHTGESMNIIEGQERNAAIFGNEETFNAHLKKLAKKWHQQG